MRLKYRKAKLLTRMLPWIRKASFGRSREIEVTSHEVTQIRIDRTA